MSGLASFRQQRFKPWFKLVWQKQVSAIFCQCNFLNINIHKKLKERLVLGLVHTKLQNCLGVEHAARLVCCVETLLLMIINSYTLKHYGKKSRKTDLTLHALVVHYLAISFVLNKNFYPRRGSEPPNHPLHMPMISFRFYYSAKLMCNAHDAGQE